MSVGMIDGDCDQNDNLSEFLVNPDWNDDLLSISDSDEYLTELINNIDSDNDNNISTGPKSDIVAYDGFNLETDIGNQQVYVSEFNRLIDQHLLSLSEEKLKQHFEGNKFNNTKKQQLEKIVKSKNKRISRCLGVGVGKKDLSLIKQTYETLRPPTVALEKTLNPNLQLLENVTLTSTASALENRTDQNLLLTKDCSKNILDISKKKRQIDRIVKRNETANYKKSDCRKNVNYDEFKHIPHYTENMPGK